MTTPTRKRWTTTEERELLAELAAGTDYETLADRFAVTRRAIEVKASKLRSGRFQGLDGVHDDEQGAFDMPGQTERPRRETYSEKGDTAELTRVVREPVRTLDDLVRVMEIDLAAWEVERWTANTWEMGSGEAGPQTLYQVKAQLRRNRAAQDLASIRDAVLADIRAEAQARPTPPLDLRPLAEASGRYLLEISPADLHVGKLAWHEETGENYDSAIASSRFRAALGDILRRASVYHIEQIVVVVGNDLSHVDNANNETTSGTRQDADSRWLRNLRIARKLMSEALRQCAQIAPTVAKIVPGNHDRQTALAIGEILAAEFADHPRVEVDNSAALRKYLHYGVSLIGWTHGSDERHADLPLIMAREVPHLWAQAKMFEWHVGHLHKSREVRYTAGDEWNGVRVRILPSLCGTDAWHAMKGYVKGRRAMEAYLWGRETGYAGHLSSNVL
jgi:hypothetical protein